jgi:hypothetical protein
MSVIDGGSFKCYQHGEETFETTDPKEWAEHLKQDHTESGSSACVVCGNPTEYKNKPTGKKAVCDNCKEDLK